MSSDLRNEILNRPIKEFIDEFKDAMDLANRSGDITATVYYANRINSLNDMVDCICEAEEDT